MPKPCDRFPETEGLDYAVTLCSYAGLRQELAESVSYAEARKVAASRIKRHRRCDRPVSVLNPGWEWEMEEAEDEVMVPDSCGTMTISCLGLHLTNELFYDYDDWTE